ncbi:NADP-dependent oxidoreductase [Acuticoccus sediminis]|uniref:NADP-dependent oxidoreductase n=1 Tax=Acuticoccus sediminis TaxID=2184697 RepID=A0A8B2NJ24_9HYPH|nr:aldo/keto reductase [Acuticoccus sediminis]RAH97230.1 NADP-dependent oxidoreductase [Acuticoccus sediminis]
MTDTSMPLVPLGRSGLRVSRLCLGTMMFGGRADETESARITDRALDAGVNFLDTADAYNEGRSEECLGRILKGRRDRLVIASKLGNPIGDDPNHRGLSPAWMLAQVPRILNRLDTDRLDVLYLHKEDPHTPLEETVRGLEILVRQGMVRHIGVSNHKSWRVAQLTRYCEEAGIGRPVVCQPLYHALNRSIEVELLPACADMEIAVYPYSPIARGVLTGKYAPGAEAPVGSRAAARDKRIMETEFHPDTVAAAARLAEHAKARGMDLGALALAFVLSNPMVSGAIVGPRTLEQLDSYLAALAVTWTAEDEAAFDAVVPKGSTAIRHFVDPAYPIEGRPAAPAR